MFNINFDFGGFIEFDGCGKVKWVVLVVGKVIFFFGFFYVFICLLDFFSSVFWLFGGKVVGEVFVFNKILSNFVVGLMIGILVMVFV